MQTLQRGLSGQPVTNSTTIASSTRSSFQVGRVRILFTHSDLSGLEDTPQFFWDVFAPGRAIYSRPLGSTDRILNILRIKYRCGRSRTQFWRGQTNVNKPHSFGWRVHSHSEHTTCLALTPRFTLGKFLVKCNITVQHTVLYQ